MKSLFTICLLALVCSTFAYKEDSARKVLTVRTTGKLSQSTEICDNKFQVADIIAAIPQWENLLTDVLNELIVLLPLVKDIVPYSVKPFAEKWETLGFKALNLFKKNLRTIEGGAQRIIDASENLRSLEVRPDQVKTFFDITSDILNKLTYPQC